MPLFLTTFKLQQNPSISNPSIRRSNLFDQITVIVVCLNAVWIVVDPEKLSWAFWVSLDGLLDELALLTKIHVSVYIYIYIFIHR